jgi:hypothetical protein
MHVRVGYIYRWLALSALMSAAACDDRVSEGKFAVTLSGAQNEALQGQAVGRKSMTEPTLYLMSFELRDPPPGPPDTQPEIILNFRFDTIPGTGIYPVVRSQGNAGWIPYRSVHVSMGGGSGSNKIWEGDSGAVHVTGRHWRNGVEATFDVRLLCLQGCPCPEDSACRVRARGHLETR